MVEKIKLSETHQYGIVNLDNKRFNKSNYLEISGFVEKPPPHKAPSNYRIVGRYILPYEVFSIIKKLPLGKDGEIQLTDSLNILVENKKINFEAFLSKAKIFDCGTKKGFIGANIALAKKDKEIFNYVRQILKISPGGGIGRHRDLKSLEGDFVPVQVHSWVPNKKMQNPIVKTEKDSEFILI